MPVLGRKELHKVKKTTVISTYVTGLAPAPGSNELSVYVDLDIEKDLHREVEVNERLKDLINRAREEDYRRPSSGTGYWRMPLDASRNKIEFTIIFSDIVVGDVAIGIAGNVRGGGRGSLILDVCWKEIIDWMNEQDRLTI